MISCVIIGVIDIKILFSFVKIGIYKFELIVIFVKLFVFIFFDIIVLKKVIENILNWVINIGNKIKMNCLIF